jgi:putative ATP-dependent endonuclease of OLD family
MRITRVEVSNYRNIDGVVVTLNPECSYLIGENNLGKSNFLLLLDTICNGRGFEDKDYLDSGNPIIVEAEIKLLPNGQGFFGGNFSPEDSSVLKIRYQQSIKDTYPAIVNTETNESIPPRMIRKLNFLKYETTSVPSKGLRLDSQKGAGLLVNSIIDRYINGGDELPTFLNDETITGLTSFINDHLNKIRSFRDYSSSGVQFMAMASINILCQIMDLYKSKSALFAEQLFTDNDDRKLLPLVLSIDEPEVHLRTYVMLTQSGECKR